MTGSHGPPCGALDRELRDGLFCIRRRIRWPNLALSTATLMVQTQHFTERHLPRRIALLRGAMRVSRRIEHWQRRGQSR
jgi:hypothetical protein